MVWQKNEVYGWQYHVKTPHYAMLVGNTMHSIISVRTRNSNKCGGGGICTLSLSGILKFLCHSSPGMKKVSDTT